MNVSMRFGRADHGGERGPTYPLPVALGGTGAATVPEAFTVASTTVSGSSTAAGTTFNLSQAAETVTGYAPICVVGWRSSGMTYLTIANLYLDAAGDLHISGRNLGTSAVAPSYQIWVLYGKTS